MIFMGKVRYSVKHFITTLMTVALIVVGLPLSFGAQVYATDGKMNGDGKAASPYIIKNADDFYAIGTTDTAGKYYKLGADIKVTKPVCVPGEDDQFRQNVFKGTFDGAGHTIELDIKSESNHTGLFGCITSGATIKNLTLTGLVESTKSYVGAITGEAYITTISAVDSDHIIISNCVNKANVSGAGYVGGLIGWARDYCDGKTITVENCGNSGNIIGGSDYYFGGLIGCITTGPIELRKCYNTGSISGADSVGGLVSLDDYTLSSANLSYCYNSGTIAADDDYKGQISAFAISPDNTINCYILDGAGTAYFDGDGNVSSFSEAEMKSQRFATALGEPFVWDKDGTVNGGFPYIEIKTEPGLTIASVDFDTATKALLKNNTLNLTLNDKNSSATLKAVVTTEPQGAENNGVEWISGNKSIATVSSTGLVSAVAAGDTTITAKSKDDPEKTVSCKVHVESKLVKEIKLAKTASISYGSTKTLSATLVPADAKNPKLSWSSSNNNVASVDQNGKVTGKKVGTSKITAKSSNGVSATCTVTVTPLDIKKAVITVKDQTYTGRPLKPEVTVKVSGKKLKAGTDYTIEFANNTKAGTAKVTVKGKGNYTGKTQSKFTINRAKNTITKVTSSKSIKLKNITVKKPATFTIAATVKEKAKLSFKQENLSKAAGKLITLSSTGKVTVKKGIKAGTYNLKVSITAKETTNYKKTTTSKTIKIIVKR